MVLWDLCQAVSMLFLLFFRMRGAVPHLLNFGIHGTIRKSTVQEVTGFQALGTAYDVAFGIGCNGIASGQSLGEAGGVKTLGRLGNPVL